MNKRISQEEWVAQENLFATSYLTFDLIWKWCREHKGFDASKALELYIFYSRCSSIQETKRIRATNSFAWKWLGRSDETVGKYLKALEDIWCVEKISTREDDGKIWKTYVKIKYAVGTTVEATTGFDPIQAQNGLNADVNKKENADVSVSANADSFSDREEDLNIPLTGEQDSPQPVSETTIPWKSITLEQFIERRNAIDTLKQNNITVRGFKKCRSPNDDIRAEWNKIRKKYLDVDIITACDNYITDIETRKPKADSDYHEHRFSLYAFLTQRNWFIKFANL